MKASRKEKVDVIASLVIIVVATGVMGWTTYSAKVPYADILVLLAAWCTLAAVFTEERWKRYTSLFLSIALVCAWYWSVFGRSDVAFFVGLFALYAGGWSWAKIDSDEENDKEKQAVE